jgi:hypothetical protein
LLTGRAVFPGVALAGLVVAYSSPCHSGAKPAPNLSSNARDNGEFIHTPREKRQAQSFNPGCTVTIAVTSGKL